MREYVIWWLDQSACELAGALGARDALWPEYIKREFSSRCGRAGRGRLWQAPEIELTGGIPWKDGDPAYDAVGRDCGGIVIRREDARHVLSWPGFVSDLDMRPIACPAKGEAAEGAASEIDQLRALVTRLTNVAEDLAGELTDPGTEALAAIYCGRNFIYG